MNIVTSNKLKTQFKKIFWITIGWILISVFQFTVSYGTIEEFNCETGRLDPLFYLEGSLLTGLLAGLIGGSVVVFLWGKWLRSMKYGNALFHIWWSFTVVYIFITIVMSIYIQSTTLNLPIFDSQVFSNIVVANANIYRLQGYFTWMFIVIGTLIILLVNDKYGPGVFRSFLLGKYFHPKREDRIFMFLDLRSSTAIAEKLGEEKYFNFLKRVYKIITPSIVYSKGEIYQYVGDEIVISWKTSKGIRNNNCINCFFEVQKALRENESSFMEKYDIKPEFKAGLHCGYVMAGEIGVIKKDIAFSGDVLNTTSRIQSKCNELGVNILFSKHLLDLLHDVAKQLSPKEMGEIRLRGKGENVLLFTV